MGRVIYTLPIVFWGMRMLGKRLIVALMILAFLASCVSNPVRDDGGQAPQASSAAGADTSPDGTATTQSPSTNHTSGGGGGFGNLGGADPRVVLALIVVLGVAIIAVLTVDYIKDHSKPGLTGKVKDGVYHAKGDAFSVALPGDYPAHGGTGFEVREITDRGQKQVVFLPATDGDPLYGVSLQPQLSAGDAAISLDDYASELYPAPASDDPTLHGKPLQPLLDEKLTLDGKPALFREYAQIAGASNAPVYYLLYFIKTGDRSALVSITWTKDCLPCSTGPESAVRAMDPHLKKFVESFHLADTQPAH